MDETDGMMHRRSSGGAVDALSRLSTQVIWGCTAILLALGAILVLGPRAQAADYPGYAQVQAAKAAVNKANASVADLDAAIAGLNDALHAADVAVREADDAYAEAQQTNEQAQLALFLANARADDATRALEAAQEDFAALARAKYRSGGNIGSLEAVTSATGFGDVIARSEAQERANETASVALDNVRAAALVEKTLREHADDGGGERDHRGRSRGGGARARQGRPGTDQAGARRRAGRPRPGRSSVSRNSRRRRPRSSGSARWGSRPRVKPPPSAPHSRRSTSAPPPVGGYSQGTTDKGEAAVNFALAHVGDMYLYGAAGPNRWDCSGLTMVAWGRQGVYLPRSSKSQYAYVKKVPYSQLRAGDLIFWGSGGSPSRVYHVAMYVRNNIIVEAPRTGYPVKTRDYRNWAAGDRMPYVGRP